jgi:hypothetical protein
MANDSPWDGMRRENHAAQSGMGMNDTACNDDGEVQLPLGWLAQQYVANHRALTV